MLNFKQGRKRESGKSATSVGEEMVIDKNTVCRWVRDYRRKYNLPSYGII